MVFVMELIIATLPLAVFYGWSQKFMSEWLKCDDSPKKEKRQQALHSIRKRGIAVIAFEVVAFAALTLSQRQLGVDLFTWGRWSLCIFMFALMVQAQVQFSVEKKIRGLKVSASQYFKVYSQGFIWTALLIAAYFCVYHLCIRSSMLLAQFFDEHHWPAYWGLGATVLGVIVGLFSAVMVTALVSPQFLRRTFPTTPLEDKSVLKIIKDCFSKAGLPLPKVWVIELDQFKFNNALVAGLPISRGPFQQALFLSRSMMTQFGHDELKAVLLHEVSHIALNHVRKRALHSVVVVLGMLLCTSLLLGASAVMRSDVMPMLSVAKFPLAAAFWISAILLIRRKVREQEIEADSHAVFVYGANLESLAGALRKLDFLSDQLSHKKDPTSYLCTGSAHPTTEQRISLLKDLAQALPRDERKRPAA